jgi:hypothetical protein
VKTDSAEADGSFFDLDSSMMGEQNDAKENSNNGRNMGSRLSSTVRCPR